MRSLFIRIFLWFWAATVLLVAVLIGTVYLTSPDVPVTRWRNLSRSFLGLYAQNAMLRYQGGGCPALVQFFARQDLFLDDNLQRSFAGANGNALCGPSLSAEDHALALRALHASSAQFIQGPEISRTASPVTAPAGERYVILLEMPRGRPPLFDIPAQTWLLRILALLVTAGLVCYGLARYFASPVRRLRAVARRFASGDLKARVGDDPLLKRKDEIAELGKDFDEMACRIEELVQHHEQLLQSHRRLLGDISHELRSPLTRLALASGLLQRRMGAEARPLLERIDRESERLNLLIGQLLTLARLDSIPLLESPENIDLKEMLEDIAADAAFEASARNVRIEVDAPVPCTMHAMRELLRSAFENVVRNAVRYTAERTLVSAELRCTRTSVSVTVSDCGPGIAAEHLPHIFDPFYRVAAARDRQTGGAGLGLAITERAVHLHRGAVEAFNRPRGGLSVCIVFPLSEADAAPARPEAEAVRASS